MSPVWFWSCAYVTEPIVVRKRSSYFWVIHFVDQPLGHTNNDSTMYHITYMRNKRQNMILAKYIDTVRKTTEYETTAKIV